ncbi:M55 family metallopeptidase (plasmid) [Haloferacaceae archaeon DSL9]
MHVFISADMEGVSGVATAEDVVRTADAYDRGRSLLHGDVNAAIDGAFEAGATDVVVNDSHSSMRNLDAERLDDRASLIRGNTKPRSMMEGLTDAVDVAFFVGYHAMAGTERAVLNHTFYGHELVELRVNGEPVGELGWNARLAGSMNIPVGLVTGDDKTAAEAKVELGTVETVETKRGIDRFSAVCRAPADVRIEIADAARRAVTRARDGDYDPVDASGPVEIEAEWVATNYALAASRHATVDRIDGRTTAVTDDDYAAAFDESIAMLRGAASGKDEYYG